MNFPSSLIKNAVEAISMFPGIGKKTAEKLNKMGIHHHCHLSLSTSPNSKIELLIFR